MANRRQNIFRHKDIEIRKWK